MQRFIIRFSLRDGFDNLRACPVGGAAEQLSEQHHDNHQQAEPF